MRDVRRIAAEVQDEKAMRSAHRSIYIYSSVCVTQPGSDGVSSNVGSIRNFLLLSGQRRDILCSSVM